ncbi:bicaudal D-related -like protein [Brachionus plicatilis]|uniref:Bicaudal D-related-like protein n=1 Tax=Brachionus plicatilis TaxID=10195 RepID=A0A3M7SKL1_BRAPC|nr:bicaudal D-related -like protein [Brachionus plicatilis]
MDHELYDELAEKEQALILAAQFGKSLIDEKEELEKQIEYLKRDHQFQLECYEQESFEMKRSLESVRNEYESKINELNDDISMLRKELKHAKAVNLDLASANQHSDSTDRIQELGEMNESMGKQIAALEYQLALANEKCHNLHTELDHVSRQLSDSSNVVSNYQKELTKCSNKQKEMEFVLVQSCGERDKQNQILDELGKKFLIIENEKNELENLVYRHETEIYNLRRINKLLSYKVNSLKLNDKNEGLMFNFSKNVKYAEDDSALDSISNLDNTSEYDDDFDIDNTYFKNQEIDEIDSTPVEVVENMRFFNCSRLLCDGVSWKQESTESEENMDVKLSKK